MGYEIIKDVMVVVGSIYVVWAILEGVMDKIFDMQYNRAIKRYARYQIARRKKIKIRKI